MADRHVTDTQGRVWSRYAIPDGVTLANGLSKEKIEAEIKKSRERRKEQERNARAKAARKAAVKRAEARKEWEERPKIDIRDWHLFRAETKNSGWQLPTRKREIEKAPKCLL